MPSTRFSFASSAIDLISSDDALAVFNLGDLGFGANSQLAAAGRIGGADARSAHDNAAGREIRPLDELHKLIECCIGIVNQIIETVNDLAEIMRRDMRCHTDRDTLRAVDQQIRKACRQHNRLLESVIVVGLKINRFLLNIRQHCG